MPKTSINQPINTIITMATIALDIGGTKIASAIFLPDGSMLFNRKRLLKGRTGHEVGKLAAEILAKLLTIARRSRIQIDGVGMCTRHRLFANGTRVGSEYPWLGKLSTTGSAAYRDCAGY